MIRCRHNFCSQLKTLIFILSVLGTCHVLFIIPHLNVAALRSRHHQRLILCPVPHGERRTHSDDDAGRRDAAEDGRDGQLQRRGRSHGVGEEEGEVGQRLPGPAGDGLGRLEGQEKQPAV